jgi:hypothetical protein
MIDEIIGILTLLVFLTCALKVLHFLYLQSSENIKCGSGEILLHPFRYHSYKFRLFFLFYFMGNPKNANTPKEKSNFFFARLFFYVMWFTFFCIVLLIVVYKN